MFARLARYEIPPDRLGDAVKSFSEAGKGLGGLQGYHSGFLLIDEDESSVMTLTIWDTRSALETSESRAGSLRRRACSEVDGSVQSVTSYEVAAELGSGDEAAAEEGRQL
jgi:heme-degrading monooxygenase HmoA